MKTGPRVKDDQDACNQIEDLRKQQAKEDADKQKKSGSNPADPGAAPERDDMQKLALQAVDYSTPELAEAAAAFLVKHYGLKAGERQEANVPAVLVQQCIDCLNPITEGGAWRCDRCGGWLHDDCVLGCGLSTCAGGYCFVCEPRHHCHMRRRGASSSLSLSPLAARRCDVASCQRAAVDAAILLRDSKPRKYRPAQSGILRWDGAGLALGSETLQQLRVTPEQEPAEVELRECEVLNVAAGILLANSGAVPGTEEAQKLSLKLRGELLTRALGDMPSVMTQAEMDVGIFCHDLVQKDHDKKTDGQGHCGNEGRLSRQC